MSGGNVGVLGGEMRGVFPVCFLMMLSAATNRCIGRG
jgi:hypothetical protein